MIEAIGEKAKELRINKHLTLKDLSDSTGLSTGFLSQFERGLTSIATDSLQKVAQALNVDLSYFFSKPDVKRGPVLKSYESSILKIDNQNYINYLISSDESDKTLMSRLIDILPCDDSEELSLYQHEGEEFLYVIEGVLTLFIDGQRHELYPCDSAHYSSMKPHNYANYTKRTTKILEISVPNYLKDE